MELIQPVDSLSTPELVAFLETANSAYRGGRPIIDDATYDHVYLAELSLRDPNHSYLNKVEPESSFGSSKIKHEKPMLSTEKAYAAKDISSFIKRVEAAAQTLNIDPSSLTYRITPKLDGMAGRYSADKLVTRGNGEVGNDISHIFTHGVKAIGGKNTGLGEIVLLQSYWEKGLNQTFSHPRNVVVGLVGADKINDDAALAIEKGAVRFVPYSSLPFINATADELLVNFNALCDELETGCEYPTDGSVIEVTNESVKEALGHTSHHYRWQIARKQVGETATSKVTAIQWQTGRTGRCTPIINIEATFLSGAWIKNVTGHHAGNIQNLRIGVGCQIRIVRSGEVIPFLKGVEHLGADPVLPNCCPSCDTELFWENDFLVCGNTLCPSQIANRLNHFFSTIGNIDLFGGKTVSRLLNHGVAELPKIYRLSEKDFQSMGFGPKQSQNLVAELQRSLREPIDDWRFIASFGIPHLGRGDSRKLLNNYELSELPSLTASDIESLDSFGPLKSPRIATELRATWPLIESMMSLGFKLTGAASAVETHQTSPIKGLNIVFTGKMVTARKTLQDEAIKLGATPQSTVTSKTDMLVMGDNVGSKKIAAAEGHGTKILSEQDYLKLISEDLSVSEPEPEPKPESTNENQLNLFA